MKQLDLDLVAGVKLLSQIADVKQMLKRVIVKRQNVVNALRC